MREIGPASIGSASIAFRYWAIDSSYRPAEYRAFPSPKISGWGEGIELQRPSRFPHGFVRSSDELEVRRVHAVGVGSVGLQGDRPSQLPLRSGPIPVGLEQNQAEHGVRLRQPLVQLQRLLQRRLRLLNRLVGRVVAPEAAPDVRVSERCVRRGPGRVEVDRALEVIEALPVLLLRKGVHQVAALQVQPRTLRGSPGGRSRAASAPAASAAPVPRRRPPAPRRSAARGRP